MRHLVLSISLTLFSTQTFAAFKCWTNAEGVTECGDSVPPEFSQQESRTVTERGITVEVQNRAKTREEVEAERMAEEEAARRRADEEQRRKQQAAYDRVLLSTFSSEEDITSSRDRKLNALDATIDITRVVIHRLDEKLEEEQRRAANLERAGRPVSQELIDNITGYQAQIADKETYIASKEADKDTIRAEYDGYLSRFQELRDR